MLGRATRALRDGRAPTFQSKLSRRLLGLGSIAAAATLLVLAVARPDPFEETRSVFARFASVQGLGKIDRNVRVGGANVGEIGTLRREGDDAIAELELEPDIPIFADARAELRPHTIFEGSAFVDLHPGSPSAPPLEEGAVIPTSRTRTYVSLDEATRVFREPIREKLRQIAASGAKTLRGEAIDGVRQTLKRAPDLLRELGPTARALKGPKGEELAGAIRGLAGTVEAVASRESELVPLTRRLNRTLAALDVDAGAPLDAALAALPGVLEELDAGGPELTRLADRLDALAIELKPVAEQLAPLLKSARPLLRRTTPIIERATPLVANLATILGRAARAAPPLLDVVRILAPGSRILAESVVPALVKESRLGVPTYLQLAAAFTGGTAAQRPYQTEEQNPLGAGHLIRLGAYADLEATVGGLRPSCSVIADIDPDAAEQLAESGLCQQP